MILSATKANCTCARVVLVQRAVLVLCFVLVNVSCSCTVGIINTKNKIDLSLVFLQKVSTCRTGLIYLETGGRVRAVIV